MMQVTLSTPDLGTLGDRWRALEARADASAFLSWTWIGCRVEQRFDRPVLLAATEGGVDVALGLFNRRGRTLWLHEAGDPLLDAVFIERNGFLIASGQEHVLPALLRALPARIVLSGVEDSLAEASRVNRGCVRSQTRVAPQLGLGRPPLEACSANTRAQVRRAMRRYEALGALTLTRADDPGSAEAMLDELVALHTATWTARGKPGAFADPVTLAFHRTLIERGVARGEVDLLRITAGPAVIGLLYNLRRSGRVLAYQSGFDYAALDGAAAGAQLKPGLMCHAFAAGWYRNQGAVSYDFLGGDAQYKRSLADSADTLHWLELAPHWSIGHLLGRLRRAG